MSTITLPTTMRALLHDQSDQTLSLASVPLPKPSATQYLVKIHAVGLTRGELLWPRPKDLTISTPGVEFAARVVASPSFSSKFRPGDEVYGRVTFPQPGAAREYSVSDDEELALRPTTISVAEAAAMPVSALTAWQALFEQFGLPPPTGTASQTPSLRILITAASGSVGIWAIQLAKLIGAYVVGTCGTANIDLVRSLGADEVLDYKTTNIKAWAEEDHSRKVDLVFDCAGGKSLEQAWHAVKEGGQVLTIAPPADMQWKFVLDRPESVSESVSGRFFVMHPSGEQLSLVTELAEQGKVKTLVDSVWKLDEYEQAFERFGSGEARGKVVIKVDDEE
ncbi:hypothetical protein LTR99_006667 [Exophiala xenobiotica]|uniref:Enoyl reductase (ER) domain-containing protein n=1 Tax=Vermiconidia calcicola TaxID=1690605 RepID=A0AAV9QD59_9PEZI|nr:hypothetical protein LTR92_007937 [Exophiala xenobiotica]KAK5533722.1 hypothetical protein LTR23_009102 [Chaetothyriales sp. CCFEE 6169]KAK5537836.1 hypothetical protein LTR25_005088 [Vermiconidia calcicola]KAK5205264.1 hypothetical protein LTR41_009113 [Exophiala xenobiotica]KAK5218959.1 hypothetical protein LTR72_008141 [Exophiala xenobiotica]